MCRCGQVFPVPVPEFSESYNTMYWPPASASQPSAVNWWNDLSPAIKASMGGAVVLIVALFAVGGSVHQYQAMHARYAPGRPAMVVSAAPVPAQVPIAPTAPSAPAPLVLEAAPRYVPPTKISQSDSQPVVQQTTASDPKAYARACAAMQDSVNVLNEATKEARAADIDGSPNSPNWDPLSRQMTIDKTEVELAKGGLSPQDYAQASDEVAQMEQSLDQEHRTWNVAHPFLSPRLN